VRANLVLLGATLCLIAALCTAPFVHHSRWERRHLDAHLRVAAGTTRQALEALAGPPSYVTDGTRWVEPGFRKSDAQLVPGCVEELWYHSGIPFIPSRFSYCFSSDGHLLEKVHWVSW
jgi:hypothetical protein